MRRFCRSRTFHIDAAAAALAIIRCPCPMRIRRRTARARTSFKLVKVDGCSRHFERTSAGQAEVFDLQEPHFDHLIIKGGARSLYTKETPHLARLDHILHGAESRHRLSGGRRECFGAPTTLQTLPLYDLRPSGRSSDVGGHLSGEWHISAPHTKSIDDNGQAHSYTAWAARCVSIPQESGVISAKL